MRVDKIALPHLNITILNFLNLITQVFFSILSKHVEHNKWPFLIQNVFVDLSISFLQIRHLNIGDIKKKILI